MAIRTHRTFAFVVSLSLLCVFAAAFYLYVAWWIPNQTMRDMAWWQDTPQEEQRAVFHQVLRFPIGNHHDAFLGLAKIGNWSSVPIIINALRWQAAPDSNGFMICTTQHAIDALQSLTDQRFGFEPEKWEQWWHEMGSKQSSRSSFQE